MYQCEYLTVKETACKCCSQFRELTQQEIDWFLLVRTAVGEPMIIHRVFSCEKHNKEVGGALRSPHLISSSFVAIDFHPQTIKILDCFYKLLNSGIGLRLGLYKGRLHVDNRLVRRLWLNVQGKNVYDTDTQV